MPQDYKKKRNKLYSNHLQRLLHSPERARAEAEFAAEHASWSDEELYAYVKGKKRTLGGQMKPANTVGYLYLLERLGPWEQFMHSINRELEQEREKEAHNGTAQTRREQQI